MISCRIRRIFFSFIASAFVLSHGLSQVNTPGNGNPLIPGYFADPTIKKFGDTWYCYATTDGIKLASGAPQVWISKDFKNWYDYKFELPRETENVWAPDVVIGPDGKYYYYYCSCQNGCSIYGYVSDTPIGPWTSLMPNNGPIIAPGFLDPIIPLDPHVFKDDDGSYYIYFCTWATYDGHGVGWAKMNADMKSFSEKGIIPNTQLPGVFEAPFMLKRDDIYYMTYSAGSTHDGTYQVRYATSNGPHGTFTYGANNPITQSTGDGTIDAPGHHSVFQDGDDYYIAYHRHDNPHSTGGLVRQVCVDKLQFDGESISKVNLTHDGIGLLGANQIPSDNLALTKKVKATSSYTDVVNAYTYKPENAVDDNNGTLWKASSDKYGEALAIDLGSVQSVKRVMIDFEYPIFYYQYRIEHSTDSLAWALYADKTSNKRPGSPMVDDKDVNARFLRITVTGMQKAGLFAGIWNVKVYNEISAFAPLQSPEETEEPLSIVRGSELITLTAQGVARGEVKTIENGGTLGGTFTAKGKVKVDTIGRRKAIIFSGSQALTLSERAPKSLSWNSSFSVATWVYNPKIGNSECIITWAARGGPLGTYAAVNYGTNAGWGAAAHWEYPDMGFKKVPAAAKWHHIVVTFDGGVEKIYVDGKLDAQEQKSLYVHEGGTIIVGWSTDNAEYLTAGISSLSMFDYPLSPDEITELYETSDPNIIAGVTDELSAHLISLYPNPSQDSNQVVVEFENPRRELTRIRVLNLQGTKMFEGDTRENSYVLHLKDYATGPYVVMVRNSKLRASKKFVVK